MTYIVFARKYRPQRFDDIIGQDHIVTVLKNGVKNNRIPHAMLFSGPRGIGKTTTARVLAKALNCENPLEGEPCLKCKSCTDILSGRDVDVIEIDGASNRGIDEIRDLREKAKYATAYGKYKIFIIDEVHMLTKEAFNALLKILEEPPEHVVFIFATTEPFNVIPTILSRCQRFDFKRLSVLSIMEQLKEICESESIPYEEAGLKLIAQIADGGMRDAESILDQIASMQQKVTYDNINSIFGRLDPSFFIYFTDALIGKDIEKAVMYFNDMISQGYDIESFVSEFAFYMHRLLLLKNSIRTEEVEIMEEERKKSALEQAKRFSSAALTQIVRELMDLSAKLKYTGNKKMLVENQISRFIYMVDSKDIDEIIRFLKNAPAARSSPEQRDVKKKSEPAVKDEEEQKIDLFGQFIEFLTDKDFFMGEGLRHSKRIFSKDNTYQVEVAGAYARQFDKKQLDRYLQEFGGGITVNVNFSSEERLMKIMKNSLENDEKVKKIVDSLDGEVL